MGNIFIFGTQPDCLCHWSGEPGGGGVHCGVRAQGAPGDHNDNDKLDNCDTYKADDNNDKADDNEKVELRLKRKLMTMLMPG